AAAEVALEETAGGGQTTGLLERVTAAVEPHRTEPPLGEEAEARPGPAAEVEGQAAAGQVAVQAGSTQDAGVLPRDLGLGARDLAREVHRLGVTARRRLGASLAPGREIRGLEALGEDLAVEALTEGLPSRLAQPRGQRGVAQQAERRLGQRR